MNPKILFVRDNGSVRELLDGAVGKDVEIVDAAPEQLRKAVKTNEGRSVIIVADALEGTLVGNSIVTQHLREKIRVIADTGAAVLISGESGTGKETAARAIHAASSSTSFSKVSCSSLPPALIERELFGDGGNPGRLDAAKGGTILLDDVDQLDYASQSRLERMMQTGDFNDVRFIATTSQDLRDAPFREDLYYRLAVVTLEMPPLRSRREDIPLLIEHFIERHARRNGRERIRLANGAVAKLSRAHWKGNVRQLESVIERAAVLCSGQTLDARDFHFDDRREEQMSMVEETFRHGSIREMEKLMILNRLRENDDNRSRSAQTLDISVRTLRNKLHEYNVPAKTRAVPNPPAEEPVPV